MLEACLALHEMKCHVPNTIEPGLLSSKLCMTMLNAYIDHESRPKISLYHHLLGSLSLIPCNMSRLDEQRCGHAIQARRLRGLIGLRRARFVCCPCLVSVHNDELVQYWIRGGHAQLL